jgi:hypothetical protein
VTQTATTSTGFTLSWTGSAGATNYTFTGTQPTSYTTGATTAVWAGLSNNQSYSIGVIATNANGNSPTTTFGAMTAPRAPIGVTPSAIVNDGFRLDWTASPGATSYTFANNSLTNCNAASLVIGRESFGANVYGGGISVAVGAYSYGRRRSLVSGNTTVSNTSYTISSNTLTNCSVLSRTVGASNGASAYGGAFSLVHNVSSFPLDTNQSVAQVIGISSVLHVYNCSFFQSNVEST